MRQARQKQLNLEPDWLAFDHAKELQAIAGLLDAHPTVSDLVFQDLAPLGMLGDTGAHGLSAYADGTVAVDMDPLSLLCRLATSVPPPRFHTIHYAGVPRGEAARCSPRRVHGARDSPRLRPRPLRTSSLRSGYARADIAPGLNSCSAHFRWTFSLAPAARGG